MTKGWRRHLCNILPATVAFGVIAPVTYMAMDRKDQVEIHSQEMTGDFVPGGRVWLRWTATAHQYCEGETRSRIISSGGVIYEYAPQPTVIRSRNGERGTYQIAFQLPFNIPPGPAHREAYISYFCNPLQRLLDWPIRVVRKYGPFEIGRGEQ